MTPRRRNKTPDRSPFPRSSRTAGVVVLMSAVLTAVCAAGSPSAAAAGAKGAKADDFRISSRVQTAKVWAPATESFRARDRKAPTAPAVLKVMRVSQTSVTLTWVAASDNVGVIGYRTHRNGVRVATTTTRSFRFTRLRCGRTYALGVTAYDYTVNGVKTEGITTSTVTINVANGDVITVKSGTSTASYTVTGCSADHTGDEHTGDGHTGDNHH